MRAASAVSCAKYEKESAHEHTGQRRQSDIPCAMALRLISRSPRGIGLSCPRRLRIAGSSAPGRADLPSADLTPTTEASGSTRLHRTLRHRSSARPVTAHGVKPALPSHRAHDAAASTASHPAFRDDRDTPLLPGETGEFVRSDLPDGLSEILPVGLILSQPRPPSRREPMNSDWWTDVRNVPILLQKKKNERKQKTPRPGFLAPPPPPKTPGAEGGGRCFFKKKSPPPPPPQQKNQTAPKKKSTPQKKNKKNQKNKKTAARGRTGKGGREKTKLDLVR